MFLGIVPQYYPFGTLHCGPGKMRAFCHSLQFQIPLCLASLLGPSWSFSLPDSWPSPFLANVKPLTFGVWFSFFRVCTGALPSWCRGSRLTGGATQASHRFSSAVFPDWPQSAFSSVCSQATLAAVLAGCWVLASFLAHWPWRSSASSYGTDDTRGHAGSLALSQCRRLKTNKIKWASIYNVRLWTENYKIPKKWIKTQCQSITTPSTVVHTNQPTMHKKQKSRSE